MNTLHRHPLSNYAGVAGFLFSAVVITQGCGGDENPAPVTPTITGGNSSGGTGGSGAKGGKSGRGGTGGDTTIGGNENIGGSDAVGGSSTTTGGTGTGKGGSSTGKGGSSTGKGGSSTGKGGSGNVPNGGSGDEGGAGPLPSCDREGDPLCYPCTPHDVNSEEFLNQCSKAQCSHFDNATRIPGLTSPLPDIP